MKHLLDIAGFLEHDIAWARCICSDLKIRASIQLMFFADYIMANTYFFELLFMIGFVPYVASTLNPLIVCKIMT